ncbi:MAG: sugar ABC transporter ATP-binding protein [Kribbellaceae bacterium]
MTDPLVRMTGIRKKFFGVPVLRGVDLELYAGEVHALVGENGAGKSTLMKVLAGIHKPTAGTVEVAGETLELSSPRAAQDAGIAIIHQELTLLPDRTVAENVFLGREPTRYGIVVDRRRMAAETARLLDWLGEPGISPTAGVRGLSVAQQQVVEIVKALAVDARVLAMDEPTAALADHEVELLYTMVRRLTERGIAVLYVSHRLTEVYDLSQKITVLKDGAMVTSRPTTQLSSDQLVRAMVGRELGELFPDRATETGDVRLEIRAGGNDRLRDVDLTVRAGEIVGVAGLQGSGRTALAQAVTGVDPLARGELLIDGRPIRLRNPRAAIAAGIAYVTEDRKSEGLALHQPVRDNALLVRRASRGALTGVRQRSVPGGSTDVDDLLGRLAVTTGRSNDEVRYLSGGNQQKVVMAKWLAIAPRVLVVDEPTRGIDVGARAALYELLRGLARDSGVAILMVSSELPEVIGMSDRVLVMHRGSIAGELPAGPTEEAVMELATGYTTALASGGAT